MTGESSTSTRRGIEVLQDHSSGLNLPPPAIDSRRDRTEQVGERAGCFQRSARLSAHPRRRRAHANVRSEAKIPSWRSRSSTNNEGVVGGGATHPTKKSVFVPALAPPVRRQHVRATHASHSTFRRSSGPHPSRCSRPRRSFRLQTPSSSQAVLSVRLPRHPPMAPRLPPESPLAQHVHLPLGDDRDHGSVPLRSKGVREAAEGVFGQGAVDERGAAGDGGDGEEGQGVWR